MSEATVRAALRESTARLAARFGEDGARDDAEFLMAHALGTGRGAMLIHHLGAPAPAGFAQLLARRLAAEPVAYILGTAEFYGRTFTVTRDVLIPRGDSETVMAAAIAAQPDPRRVLDCGTGSGALMLTVLAERPQAHGLGIDRSPPALTVASGNAAALGLSNRAEWQVADWTRPGWTRLGRTGDMAPFDLILANPPYVETGAPLDASVRDYEPAGALFAGAEGLDDYRVLLPCLPALLSQDGVAVVEIGASQDHAVTHIARGAGLQAELRRDLAGRARALVLRRQPGP